MEREDRIVTGSKIGNLSCDDVDGDDDDDDVQYMTWRFEMSKI